VTNAQDLPEPTRGYADGCDRENELLLHVADDPWLGGDFCMDHAQAIIASTPLILTCECGLCARARRVASSAHEEPRLEGPGRWLVSTESSGYLLELDESGSGRWCGRSARVRGPLPRLRAFPPPSPLGFDGTGSLSRCSGPRSR
jgi:hypothetical protein